MDNAQKTVTSFVRSVQLVKVDGFSLTRIMGKDDCIKSRWSFDGYDWEVRVYPNWESAVLVELALLSKPRRASVKRAFLRKARRGSVRVALGCRLVDPTGKLEPSMEVSKLGVLSRPKECIFEFLMTRCQLAASGYVGGDSFTVQCTIDVLKELLPDTATTDSVEEVPVPSSNLHRHLAELLQSKKGADVTFLVSGKSFAAQKNILAARSPVFMAEFFGNMKENCARRVEIKDMQPAVFKVLLHFIYTDTVPEFDENGKEVTVLAQHLLAAADRYGLDRLMLICESKLSCGITVDTAATSLALADQHNCLQLKAKCVQFIVRNREVLDAVLATEGYKYLAASCPSVLSDLLKSSLRVGESSASTDACS